MKHLASFFLPLMLTSCEQKNEHPASNESASKEQGVTIAEETDQAPSADKEVQRRLNSIIIPSIDFENTPLDEAIEYLTQKSIELSPDSEPSRRGISFVIEKGSTTPGAQKIDEDLGGGSLLLGDDPNTKIIRNYQATNISLSKALVQICALVDLDAYVTSRGPLLFLPKGNKPAESEGSMPLTPGK